MSGIRTIGLDSANKRAGGAILRNGGPKLISRCIALPAPLWEFIDAQAAEHGQNRNAHVHFLLALHRRHGLHSELSGRVAKLEKRSARKSK